jgi:hypothetical protein
MLIAFAGKSRDSMRLTRGVQQRWQSLVRRQYTFADMCTNPGPHALYCSTCLESDQVVSRSTCLLQAVLYILVCDVRCVNFARKDDYAAARTYGGMHEKMIDSSRSAASPLCTTHAPAAARQQPPS